MFSTTSAAIYRPRFEQSGACDADHRAVRRSRRRARRRDRYFSQSLGEADPGRKDLLLDIATEELSHLEVIGTIVAMLNKGVKVALPRASMNEADLSGHERGGDATP